MNDYPRSIPQNIKTLFDNLASQFQEILRDDFVGLYVHGSLAMGCFNPLVSDIDFLVVVRKNLDVQIKRDFANRLLNAKCDVPKGMEMSVVLLQHTQDCVYPTPFEFHYSTEVAEKHRRGEIDYSKEDVDPDLAAQFTVTRNRGIAWRGLPIDEVFADVPKDFYIKSLLRDFDDLDKNILTNPVYGILNACRTVAYLRDGLVLSKGEGGEWSATNLDFGYRPLIHQALSAYEQGGNTGEWDAGAASSFVRYIKALVKKLL